MASPAPVEAAGNCALAGYTNQHYIVQKHHSDVGEGEAGFDAVTGSLEARGLDNCLGVGVGMAAGTAVLAANVETTTGIYQLGIRDDATWGLRFIYADKDDNAIIWPGTSISSIPVIGRKYIFTIHLHGAGGATFSIKDTVTGVTELMTGRDEDTGFAYGTWWGAERLDTVSGIGNQHAEYNYDLTDMKYSMTNYSGWITRTGLNVNSISSTAWQGHDFYRAPGTPTCAERHVYTTTYTNDSVMFDMKDNC